MKQSSFDLNLFTRRTRKQVFLQQMDTVVPWAALVELIAPYYSEGRNGRSPFLLEISRFRHRLEDHKMTGHRQ
jgi:transposase, IS5 family